MSPWEFTDESRGKYYARQLKLRFKRHEEGRCVECPNSSPVLPLINGKRAARCERHLAYQRGRGKKLVNGKEEGK